MSFILVFLIQTWSYQSESRELETRHAKSSSSLLLFAWQTRNCFIRKTLLARKLPGRSFCGEAQMSLRFPSEMLPPLGSRSVFWTRVFSLRHETCIWRGHGVWNLKSRHRNSIKRTCLFTMCFPGSRKEAHLLQHAWWGYSNDGLWSISRLYQILNFLCSSFPSLLAMSCH